MESVRIVCFSDTSPHWFMILSTTTFPLSLTLVPLGTRKTTFSHAILLVISMRLSFIGNINKKSGQAILLGM